MAMRVGVDKRSSPIDSVAADRESRYDRSCSVVRFVSLAVSSPAGPGSAAQEGQHGCRLPGSPAGVRERRTRR